MDNQHQLLSQDSLMNDEQYYDIFRLQSRVSHLETDLPSSSNFSQNLRRELESIVDKAMTEFETLGSRVSLLEGEFSSS